MSIIISGLDIMLSTNTFKRSRCYKTCDFGVTRSASARCWGGDRFESRPDTVTDIRRAIKELVVCRTFGCVIMHFNSKVCFRDPPK